jgi:hypothetical protein
MVTLSKTYLYGCLLAGIASSNPAGSIDVCLPVTSVVCCQVEVSASSSSLRGNPTECNREASITSKPWSTKGCCALVGKKLQLSVHKIWGIFDHLNDYLSPSHKGL